MKSRRDPLTSDRLTRALLRVTAALVLLCFFGWLGWLGFGLAVALADPVVPVPTTLIAKRLFAIHKYGDEPQDFGKIHGACDDQKSLYTAYLPFHSNITPRLD